MARFIRISVAAVLAASLAFLLVPAAQASGPKSRAERAFLTEMVSHHSMAIDMAEMAQEKATHPELKAMADEIISSQSAERKSMQSWLKRWYGKRAKPVMSHGDMMMMEELEKAATPAEFEVRFMALMTMHHTQAVERARAIRSGPIHSQTRKLARDIIRAQDREIEQMRSWLAAWYGN